MTERIIFVADFFANQIKGGGELNDWELISLLRDNGSEVETWNSNQIRADIVKKWISSGCKFIISNFVSLSGECRDLIAEHGDYVICEHDHKYLESRNPMDYPDFKAPPDKIINREFYSNAKAVFCQSGFHVGIVRKNLEIDNLVNLSGNLWSNYHLEILEDMSKVEKDDSYAVINYPIPHKNVEEAIRYCKYKDLKFNIIDLCSPQDFLKKLGKNGTLVFFPQSPETLSRIVVESRMMGMKTRTTKNIGAVHEPWFAEKGIDLIKIMREKRNSIPALFLEKLDG